MTPRWFLILTRSRLPSSEYQRYIRSGRWARTRKRYYKWHGRHCHRCGKRRCRLELHHKTYERLGRERMSDLIALCEDCHHAAHARRYKRNYGRFGVAR